MQGGQFISTLIVDFAPMRSTFEVAKDGLASSKERFIGGVNSLMDRERRGGSIIGCGEPDVVSGQGAVFQWPLQFGKRSSQHFA